MQEGEGTYRVLRENVSLGHAGLLFSVGKAPKRTVGVLLVMRRELGRGRESEAYI